MAHCQSGAIGSSRDHAFIGALGTHGHELAGELEVRGYALELGELIIHAVVCFFYPLLLGGLLVHLVVLSLLGQHAGLDHGLDIETGAGETVYSVHTHDDSSYGSILLFTPPPFGHLPCKQERQAYESLKRVLS